MPLVSRQESLFFFEIKVEASLLARLILLYSARAIYLVWRFGFQTMNWWGKLPKWPEEQTDMCQVISYKIGAVLQYTMHIHFTWRYGVWIQQKTGWRHVRAENHSCFIFLFHNTTKKKYLLKFQLLYYYCRFIMEFYTESPRYNKESLNCLRMS